VITSRIYSKTTASLRRERRMKLNELKRTIAHLEECDELLTMDFLKDKSVSGGAKDAISAALLQRKHNLLDKLRYYGVEVEV
jgi:hypothetical protein